MSEFILSQNVIYPSNQLSSTMILLDEWSFVYIKGRDAHSYLQNQFTIDMNLLKKTHYTICAHCNFNGKVLSTMYLFHYREGYGYIQRKSIAHTQIQELKKYSVFSHIQIHECNDMYLIGIAGLNCHSLLLNLFKNIPDKNLSIVHENNITILWFREPSERYLLILNSSDFVFLKKNIHKKIFFNYSKQWLLLDIAAGFPIIDKKCSNKFTPQAINLDKLNGISFEKGCYYGQETIARIYFNNLNKFYLSYLVGKGKISPEINSLIEVKLKEKWCKVGILLSIVHMHCEEMLIQIVLYRPVNINNIFRIRGFENIFFMKTI